MKTSHLLFALVAGVTTSSALPLKQGWTDLIFTSSVPASYRTVYKQVEITTSDHSGRNAAPLTGWATRLDVKEGSETKELERMSHARRPLTGWATRLNINEEDDGVPEEDSPIIFQKTHATEQPSPFYASDPFTSLSAKAWAWAGQRLFGSKGHRGKTSALSAPFFAAYGDSYVESNSLGVPDPSRLKGFTHYNVAFWTTSAGPADNALDWSQGTKAQRQAIVKAYNSAGIRLGVSAFGATDKPQDRYSNATEMAVVLKGFVKGHSLQGIDIDYEDSNRLQRGEATNWLIPLQRELRNQLPAGDYYITHAPQAPYFNKDLFQLGYDWFNERVGDLVDFYNVQFYNQDSYEDCTGLITSSGNWAPGTSLFELNSQHDVPLEKIVVGKPATSGDADNGYMAPDVLGKCLKKATNKGWNGGVMLWEFKGGNGLNNIISSIKSNAGFQ